jgi:acyl-CoA synthetase (AMP-forming)/AMP-acid ligase II
MPDTLFELLSPHPDDAPALGGLDWPWMSHGALRSLAEATQARLNAFGIGPGDRVAIVLPNGPEMAAAFVAIGCTAVTCPLNPAYREEEYDFYLGDLSAKALVVEAGYDGPALASARKLGVGVIRLRGDTAKPAGWFELDGDASLAEARRTGYAGPDEIALILHTSGTTSRPKIVPLLHRNLSASARNIGATLRLGPEDRCLNIMPLFHIHGLIAAVTSSLAAGGSIWCAPGFNALQFFGWLDLAKPTWFTAVPTMHQSILSRAERNQDVLARSGLRFIRSSSASLPPQVMTALEETIGAPVIESYGMTEACHQMTSNPLPPLPRHAGSVGVEAGPLVRVASESEGRILDAGATGEVVISGPNVTPGYEANPAANASAFFEAEGRRWFRTGDQGAIDAEGYLRLTGRLKEIINRGGEKVSPLEVDEVLMDHPAVQQVVTFAIPHEKLGEEVAAAVVPREGQSIDEASLRDFASARLASFKVPRRVVVLDEIPKGATGKLQRIGLAEKLGLVP